MKPSNRLSYDPATRVFTLTTTDEQGEHVEQFTAPTGCGSQFNVEGVDCCAIADILSRSVRDGEMPQTVAFVASDLADYFQAGNPRFDRARFLAACGVEELTAAPAVDSACR